MKHIKLFESFMGGSEETFQIGEVVDAVVNGTMMYNVKIADITNGHGGERYHIDLGDNNIESVGKTNLHKIGDNSEEEEDYSPPRAEDMPSDHAAKFGRVKLER